MTTTKEAIEKDLQLKEKEYEVIYSPTLPSDSHGGHTIEYKDGAKIYADIDPFNEQILWNDYYVANNLYLKDKIKHAQEKLNLQRYKERTYPSVEEGQL